MRDKLTDAIRIGIVSSIDPDRGTAKVTFKDRDGIVSRDLPLNFTKTLHDYDYCMPDVGERVRCFFDPEAPSRGFILGSFPSDTREPPIKNSNKRYTLFRDGTLIEYDRALHKLTVRIPEEGAASIDIFAESDIDVKTNGNISIKSAGNVQVEAAGNIDIQAAKDVSITGGESITINASLPVVIRSEVSVTLQGATESLTVS